MRFYRRRYLRRLRLQEIVALRRANRELTRQIETRDAEIVAQSSTLIGRNEIILRLRDMVNEFQQKQGSRTTAPLWQKVNAYVSSKLDTESDWTLFLIKFEQKHSSYFRIMKERFPDLTTSDLRLSACLKMKPKAIGDAIAVVGCGYMGLGSIALLKAMGYTAVTGCERNSD